MANVNIGINGRGLVVSVWHERDSHQGINPRTAPALPTAAQKIRLFEEGNYPGYGKFAP